MVNCTENSLVITPSPPPPTLSHTEIQVISVKLHGEWIMRYLYLCHDLKWILLIIWLCRLTSCFGSSYSLWVVKFSFASCLRDGCEFHL